MSQSVTPSQLSELEGVPFVPFDQHLAGLDWRQGEHVALVGPTGQGKTTLALRLVMKRKYVMALATKAEDSTLRGLTRQGWVIIRKWPPRNGAQRVILWPRWADPSDTPKQAAVMREALYKIFKVGSWCILVDDVEYLTTDLRLGGTLRALWNQARAMRVSVVGATQRPRWTPVTMWANSSHVYIWGTQHQEDMRALAGLSGVDVARVRTIVKNLPPYYALYVPLRRAGEMQITKVDL